jgi:3-isopropylmalate/(R)-2-methylmalate dehydratase small subunit
MITTFLSRAVVLLGDNVDTDQIIPARFLTTTDKTGLGAHLFADWRYDASHQPRADFVLNHPEADGAQVLVAGHNFGCGSSREHAPWALLGFGFRAVVSTRFADIFRNNALKNGLLPIAISAPAHARLVELLRQQPDAKLAIDLAGQTVTLPDGTRETFPVDPFAKHCLLQGLDELGYLLQAEPSIAQYEATHIARVQTTAAVASPV